MYIGDRIQQLRKAKGWSLVEMAQKSGVQIATLSRIEHKKMIGSLDSHKKIAEALEITIPELYENINIEKKEEKPTSTVSDHKTPSSTVDMYVHTQSSSYDILSSRPTTRKMIPLLLKLEIKGQTNPEQHDVGAEKFIYVTEGIIEAVIGNQTLTLSKNNSLYFNGDLKHYFKNAGKGPARGIVVVTPATL